MFLLRTVQVSGLGATNVLLPWGKEGGTHTSDRIFVLTKAKTVENCYGTATNSHGTYRAKWWTLSLTRYTSILICHAGFRAPLLKQYLRENTSR